MPRRPKLKLIAARPAEARQTEVNTPEGYRHGDRVECFFKDGQNFVIIRGRRPASGEWAVVFSENGSVLGRW